MKKKKHIEILARGVFVDGGKILLCHTKGANNTYLPGGHVEFGESAKMALQREIKEELGGKATVGHFLGAVEHSFDQKGRWHCEINLVFEFTIKGLRCSDVPVSQEDYIEFRWVPMRDLREVKLEPSLLCNVIPLWLKRKRLFENWLTNLE